MLNLTISGLVLVKLTVACMLCFLGEFFLLVSSRMGVVPGEWKVASLVAIADSTTSNKEGITIVGYANIIQPAIQDPPPSPPSAPPNGGVLAWMQVAASFCIFFSTW